MRAQAPTLGGVTRTGIDQCPGIIRPFLADDGAIMRFRAPGGLLPITSLTFLTSLAGELGEGSVTLTSRGNLQIRGLPEVLPESVTAQMRKHNLLATASHERARNIVASPWAMADSCQGKNRAIVEFVRLLDAALQNDPALAELSGRFMFLVQEQPPYSGFDLPFDVTTDPTDPAGISIGVNTSAGIAWTPHQENVLSLKDRVASLLALVRRFLAARPDETTWNMRDIPRPQLEEILGPLYGPDSGEEENRLYGIGGTTTAGRVGFHRGHLSLGVPLGVLDANMSAEIRKLAAVAGATRVVITPVRTIVIPGGEQLRTRLYADVLAGRTRSGLALRSGPATVVTACPGAPHCRRAENPTLPIARELLSRPAIAPVHIVGCARDCGSRQGALTVRNPVDADAVLAKLEVS